MLCGEKNNKSKKCQPRILSLTELSSKIEDIFRLTKTERTNHQQIHFKKIMKDFFQEKGNSHRSNIRDTRRLRFERTHFPGFSSSSLVILFQSTSLLPPFLPIL